MNVKIDDLSRFSLNKWRIYPFLFYRKNTYTTASMLGCPTLSILYSLSIKRSIFIKNSNLLCKTYLSISMHVTRKHIYTLSILGFGQVSSLSNHWSGHSLLRVHWLVRLHHPQLYLVSMVRHSPQLVTMYLHL